MFILLPEGERYRKTLSGEICVPNEFLHVKKEKQTSEPDALPMGKSVVPSLVEDNTTPLALNQYVDFDSECSGLFGDHEVEAAKRLMNDG
jgi:hypothetical protein